MNMRKLTGAALFALLAGVSVTTSAQTYPSKPITIVVPFPAGGSSDYIARLVGRRLSDDLGQPVVVENRAGGGGSIGVLHMVQAPPDGHTLLITTNGPLNVIPHLYKNAKYTTADISPVAMVFTAPFFVTVPATSPYKSFAEILEKGRTKDANTPMYGSTGSGNASHLLSEMINSAAGTQFIHVPYKGAAPLSLGLISGETHFGLQMAVDSKANIDAGKLRPLAVLAAKRSPPWPDVPTLGELGVPGMVYGSWVALIAPLKTPRPIVDTLNRSVRNMLSDPAVLAKLREMGADPGLPVNTPEKLREVIETESKVFKKAIDDAKIQAD